MPYDLRPPSLAPRLYSISETMRLTGDGRTRTYQLMSQGVLDARKAGTKTMVTAESIDRYVASLPRAEIHLTGYEAPPASEDPAGADEPEDAPATVAEQRQDRHRPAAITGDATQ